VKPVLRIPTYRRLLAAYTLNELAFMVGAVTLTLLIYRRTGSALGATAFFLCSQFVPGLLSPLLVARLDQLPLRPLLPALYWIEAVIFVVLAMLTGRYFTLSLVLALALLNGILALTARALARAATVTVTSAAGLLREGNAVVNAGFSLAFLIGPGIGGAVVAAGGTSQVLLGDAALFAVIGITLATSSGLPRPAPRQGPARGRVRAALAYAGERPALRGVLLIQVFGILFFTISVPVEVVFVTHSLHGGAAGYGAMVSAWGAGAVAGAAVYARWRHLPSPHLIALGAGALGLGFVIMAAAPDLGVAIGGAAVAGVGNGIESVAGRTAVQELVDERWMALMMSLQETIFQSVPGIGILLGGTITALGSPRAAFAIAGAGSLVISLLAWLTLGPLVARAEPVAEAVVSPQGPNGAVPEPAVPRGDENGVVPDAGRAGSRREHARTPVVPHQ
jgi:hypothetical protein